MKLDYDDKLFGESASCAGTLALNLGVGLALCALLLLMASGIGVRLGAWHFRTGFTILKYAAYGGGAAILMTLTAIVLAIKEGKSIGLVAVLVAGRSGSAMTASTSASASSTSSRWVSSYQPSGRTSPSSTSGPGNTRTRSGSRTAARS